MFSGFIIWILRSYKTTFITKISNCFTKDWIVSIEAVFFRIVIALSEKGRTYREITKEAGVSPNTIKAILNKAGLDQTTLSLSLRQSISMQFSLLQVASKLDIGIITNIANARMTYV